MQLAYVVGVAVAIGGACWTAFIAQMSEKYKDA